MQVVAGSWRYALIFAVLTAPLMVFAMLGGGSMVMVEGWMMAMLGVTTMAAIDRLRVQYASAAVHAEPCADHRQGSRWASR